MPRHEALFELQVDAFLEGCADLIPDPDEFGLTKERAAELQAKRILESLTEEVA